MGRTQLKQLKRGVGARLRGVSAGLDVGGWSFFFEERCGEMVGGRGLV